MEMSEAVKLVTKARHLSKHRPFLISFPTSCEPFSCRTITHRYAEYTPHGVQYRNVSFKQDSYLTSVHNRCVAAGTNDFQDFSIEAAKFMPYK